VAERGASAGGRWLARLRRSVQPAADDERGEEAEPSPHRRDGNQRTVGSDAHASLDQVLRRAEEAREQRSEEA
jgi:hypothetical protein